MGGRSNQTRRTVLTAIGATLATGTVSGRGNTEQEDESGIELIEHEFRWDRNLEVEVTLANNREVEVQPVVEIELFDGDYRIDETTLRYGDMPPETMTSENATLFDVDHDGIDEVTHYTISVREAFNDFEETYTFEEVGLDEPVEGVPKEEPEIEEPDEEEGDPEEAPSIEIVEHEFRWDYNLEVEVTLTNNREQDLDPIVDVELFEDDYRIDNISLHYPTLPPGTTSSETRLLFDADRNDLDRVTHYTITVEEAFNDFEEAYTFEEIELGEPIEGIPEEEPEIEEADQPDDVDKPLELVDHAFRWNHVLRAESTITNHLDHEVIAAVDVRIYEDDHLLDDASILFGEVTAEVTTTESVFLADIEQDDLDTVTHYTLTLRGPWIDFEETYEFDEFEIE